MNPLKPKSSNYYTLPYRPNLPFLISDAQVIALNIRNVTVWWHWALKG